MRTGEYFAHHAKVSTEKMENLTVKTRQETISIHVITILTLIFLPGTFVAVRYGLLSYLYNLALWALTGCQTFFSSGIIDFENSPAMEMWDWKTKWGAMQLFAIICGPLSTLVFIAWAIAYCVARRNHNDAISNSTWDEEKGKRY